MSTPETSHSTDLKLLRVLEEHPEYSQRQLATALGLSLGKTHYLLKALLGKGLVKAQNFRRSDHKLGYLYVLTPSGVNARLQLTRSFLARKEAEYEALREQISSLRDELALVAGARLSTAAREHRPFEPPSKTDTGAHS